MKNLKEIRQFIASTGADAWLIYDFASTNPAFTNLFGSLDLTRKCFVIIKPKDNITVICHTIDRFAFSKQDSPDTLYKPYNNWHQLFDILQTELHGFKKILMEISENGLMPRSSFADYGTVTKIKEMVPCIESSGDLFQYVSARLGDRSVELHKKAAKIVDKVKDEAFEFIFRQITEHGSVSEYEVQQKIICAFGEHNMVTDSVPIVAVGKNSNNPHYEPSKEVTALIKKNDLVLIDLWAKLDQKDAVFADITWMGFTGKRAPDKVVKVFDIVKASIDGVLEFLDSNLPKRPVCGYEVDDVCRNIIIKNGYGDYFIHRTGHSLSTGESDHGIGVNIDNFETHDTRTLMDRVAFSIEPGIYLPDFGIREEINVLIDNKKPIVTTRRQDSIICDE